MAQLKSVAGWRTARVKRPVLILCRLDGIETGVWQFIREQPKRSVQLAGEKILRTWSPRPLSKEFSKPLYVAAALAFCVPFDLLVILGLFYDVRPGKSLKLFLIAPALYLTVTAAASVGSLRYRIPAEVPMSLLAAGGLSSLFGKIRAAAAVPESPHVAPDVS